MDRVVHFEIPTDDLNRAKKFYSDCFAWQLTDAPMPGVEYVMVRTAEVDDKQRPKAPGAINGGMMKRGDKVKSPVITISVADIDNALQKIEASGGKIVLGKMNVGDMGLAAYFSDTEGNVIGLWQDLQPAA